MSFVARHCGVVFFALAACLLAMVPLCRAADSGDGVALAVVFDTSGSMLDLIPAEGGKKKPKYEIARAAMGEIVGQVEEFAKNNPVDATLVTFDATPIPLSGWNARAFREWLSGMREPIGPTPLGESIASAASQLAKSPKSKKHIVIVTDGESNGKLKPEDEVRRLRQLPPDQSPEFYLVAFDVNSKNFDGVKKEGALVLPATGKTLASGLKQLFGEKILLEDPE